MRRFRARLDEGELAGIAFGDPVRDMDALFLHANGFNALTYQSLLAPLGNRAHVGGLDLRGHGLSTAPAKPGTLKSWTLYRDDVITALEQVAPRGTVLAGHSMGATVALMVAGKRPDLVNGLILADPVLMMPSRYAQFHIPGMISMMARNIPIARTARKRRARFDSPEAAFENFREKPIFRHWREPFLQDYVTDGVVRREMDGDWELACQPDWEAASFGAQRNRPWSALKKVECPVVVVLAEKGSTCSPSAAQKISQIKPLAFVQRVQGTSHFLPMERPYAVRDRISDFLSKIVEGFAAGEEGRVQRNLDGRIGEKD